MLESVTKYGIGTVACEVQPMLFDLALHDQDLDDDAPLTFQDIGPYRSPPWEAYDTRTPPA